MTDEDRENASKINSLKWEIKRTQLEREDEIHRLRLERDKARLEAEIKSYQGEDGSSGEGNSSTDELTAPLLGLVMASLQNRGQPAGNSITSPPSPTVVTQPAGQVSLHLTDEQIDDLLAQLPKTALKMAKKLSP